MRARRHTRQFAVERDERDTGFTQVDHQVASLGAIRAQRDVYRAAMIEAQTIVRVRLPDGAYRQRPAEALAEKTANFFQTRKRPIRAPVVAYQRGSRGPIQLLIRRFFGERESPVVLGDPLADPFGI